MRIPEEFEPVHHSGGESVKGQWVNEEVASVLTAAVWKDIGSVIPATMALGRIRGHYGDLVKAAYFRDEKVAGATAGESMVLDLGSSQAFATAAASSRDGYVYVLKATCPTAVFKSVERQIESFMMSLNLTSEADSCWLGIAGSEGAAH